MSGLSHRRTFLKSSLALCSGVALKPWTTLGTENKRPGMKKALMFGMVEGNASLLEKFRMLKEIGFDGVEMDSPGKFEVKEVLEARDATGLLIPGVVDSVHWKMTLSDPDPEVRAQGLDALRTALRECKIYGGSSVLLVPAVVNQNVNYRDAYQRSQAEIRKAIPLAEELGIVIAIENVWNQFLLSPLEAARYIDELNSPWVGWHLDIGNVINYGWPEQWVQILGKRIVKLHIKDYSRKKRDEEGLWAGFKVNLWEGDCDWPAVMKALDGVGYRGWGSAELAGGGPEHLKDISDRMNRIYNS
ncbi:MAG: sugar phosphate isomerase/epimerase family protein [Terriglobia bacterium]